MTIRNREVYEKFIIVIVFLILQVDTTQQD